MLHQTEQATMSAAGANVFALLDDEGTLDAGALAAKIPVAQKETVKSDGM